MYLGEKPVFRMMEIFKETTDSLLNVTLSTAAMLKLANFRHPSREDVHC